MTSVYNEIRTYEVALLNKLAAFIVIYKDLKGIDIVNITDLVNAVENEIDLATVSVDISINGGGGSAVVDVGSIVDGIMTQAQLTPIYADIRKVNSYPVAGP